MTKHPKNTLCICWSCWRPSSPQSTPQHDLPSNLKQKETVSATCFHSPFWNMGVAGPHKIKRTSFRQSVQPFKSCCWKNLTIPSLTPELKSVQTCWFIGPFCQSIVITDTHHKFTKIENTIFKLRTWLNYNQPQSPPAHSLCHSMILVTQASRIPLCLALARLELREDMSLIKDTHRMHNIRVRVFTNINCLKILPRTVTQFRFTYLSNCSPQTMNGLPSNSTGSSSADLLHSRRREVAFRRPRRTSAWACVKAMPDYCTWPMMRSGWRLKRLTASCRADRSLPFHPRITTKSPSLLDPWRRHSPQASSMTPCLAGQALCWSGPPCWVSDRRSFFFRLY